MIHLNREIEVTVCAHSADELALWVAKFDELFNATTHTSGYGVWEGIHEHHVRVSHLFDSKNPDWSHYELSNLVHNYKREAKQFAVLVVEREVKGRMYV